MTGWELAIIVLVIVGAINYGMFIVLNPEASIISPKFRWAITSAFLCVLIACLLQFVVIERLKNDCKKQTEQTSQVFLPGLEASERATRKDACVMKGMRVVNGFHSF